MVNQVDQANVVHPVCLVLMVQKGPKASRVPKASPAIVVRPLSVRRAILGLLVQLVMRAIVKLAHQGQRAKWALQGPEAAMGQLVSMALQAHAMPKTAAHLNHGRIKSVFMPIDCGDQPQRPTPRAHPVLRREQYQR